MQVSFIGLGLMGNRMAKRLLNHDIHLKIHNRTKSKAQDLIQSGAQWCSSPGEAADGADIVITMLADPAAVEETAFGDEGFTCYMKKDSVWLDCSTVHPSFSENVSQRSHDLRIHFLDAPVLGSLQPAEKGELIFLIGGEENIIRRVNPILSIMGKKIVPLGKAGSGSKMKIIHNMMLANAMVAFSESLALAKAEGLDEQQAMEILLQSPSAAPFLQGKKEKIQSQVFDPEFPLQHMHKDLRMAARSAQDYRQFAPLANLSKELFAMAVQLGWGEEDFSAIIKLHRLSAK